MGTSRGTVVDGLNHAWNEPLSGKREIDQKHNHTCIEGVEFGNKHRGEQVRCQIEGICRNAKVQRRGYVWAQPGIYKCWHRQGLVGGIEEWPLMVHEAGALSLHMAFVPFFSSFLLRCQLWT